MNSINSLQNVANAKPDTHWYVPDNNGFIKAIPKEIYAPQGDSSQIPPLEQLETTVYNVHQFVVNNPTFFRGAQNLDGLLRLQQNLCVMAGQVGCRGAPAMILQNIMKITSHKAILTYLGMTGTEVILPENKEKNLERLRKLQFKICEEALKCISIFSEKINANRTIDEELMTDREKELIRICASGDYAKELEGADIPTRYRIVNYLIDGNAEFGPTFLSTVFRDIDLEELDKFIKRIPTDESGMMAISCILCYLLLSKKIDDSTFFKNHHSSSYISKAKANSVA